MLTAEIQSGGAALPVGLSVTGQVQGLADLKRDDCAGLIWQRPANRAVQAWLERLSPQQLPHTRVTLKPDVIAGFLRGLCSSQGVPDCAERDMLIADIASLAQVFAGVMRCDFIRLRLDVVQTNACRKFHLDAVTARLVCTYLGTGTQFGAGQQGTEPDPARIGTVPTGAPILLRGTLWPSSARPGLLHRSPPIEGTGETRLVLVLDPA